MKPYAVHIQTSQFSGGFEFATLREAIAYLEQQYRRNAVQIARQRYCSFDARRSCIKLPGDVVVTAREFIGDSMSSY